MLQEYTNRIFKIVDELENNISDKQNFIGGTINIGGSNTPGTYILPEIIGEFKKLHPNINISLHIANTAEISHLVSNGTLDIAVNGGSCIYNNYIYVEKLLDDKLIIVASPQNPYCKQASISIEDLHGMSFVVHKTDSQLYTFYRKFIDELNIPENVSMYLGNIDAIKKAVISNLGISLIPTAAVKFELQYGILKALKLQEYQLDYSYSLIYNKNKSMSATSRKFIEFLRDNIGKHQIEI
jgi:DNA-binding transcriptional LysR family regulator